MPATMAISLSPSMDRPPSRETSTAMGIVGEWITDDDLARLTAALAAAT